MIVIYTCTAIVYWHAMFIIIIFIIISVSIATAANLIRPLICTALCSRNINGLPINKIFFKNPTY